jgi:hypothetical protein
MTHEILRPEYVEVTIKYPGYEPLVHRFLGPSIDYDYVIDLPPIDIYNLKVSSLLPQTASMNLSVKGTIDE